MDKPFVQFLIVHQYEEEIDYTDERSGKIDDGTDSATHELEHLRYPLFQDGCDVGDSKQLGKFLCVDIRMYIQLEEVGHLSLNVVALHKLLDDSLHLLVFSDERGYYQHSSQVEYSHQQNQRHHDSCQTVTQFAAILKKTDDGVEQIGDKPCHEERGEDIAQFTDQQEEQCENSYGEKDAGKAVECDCFHEDE